MLGVKRANLEDLELLLGIASARRTAYAEYQPRFWRPAPDAVDRQRAYFTSILDDDKTLVLTATEDDACSQVSPSAASFRLRPSTILEELAAWLTISQSPTPRSG